MASERETFSACPFDHVSILTSVSFGKRVAIDGSCPVAGLPRDFLCADIAFFIFYVYAKNVPTESTNFRPAL